MCTARDTHQYFMKASPVRPGDFIEFFAEIDLLVALSACPGGDCGASHSDDTAKCYPLKIEVHRPRGSALVGWQSPPPIQIFSFAWNPVKRSLRGVSGTRTCWRSWIRRGRARSRSPIPTAEQWRRICDRQPGGRSRKGAARRFTVTRPMGRVGTRAHPRGCRAYRGQGVHPARARFGAQERYRRNSETRCRRQPSREADDDH